MSEKEIRERIEQNLFEEYPVADGDLDHVIGILSALCHPERSEGSVTEYITETSFRGCLFFVCHFPVHKNSLFYGRQPQKQL